MHVQAKASITRSAFADWIIQLFKAGEKKRGKLCDTYNWCRDNNSRVFKCKQNCAVDGTQYIMAYISINYDNIHDSIKATYFL